MGGGHYVRMTLRMEASPGIGGSHRTRVCGLLEARRSAWSGTVPL